jgi:hydroxyacylglutathione hydrolase
MFFECIDTGLLSSNCYIIGDSGEAAVIDPGASVKAISEVLDREKLDLKFIILTHVHLDHIISMDKLRQKYNAKVLVHSADAEALGDPEKNCSSLFGYDMKYDSADKCLSHGDIIAVGGLKLEIIHTPGHTPGGISIKTANIIFTGDTLFKLGVGRTDLTGGDGDLLWESINKRLMTLDDDVIAYPGHGPSTTIGFEKRNNPYL